MARRRTRASAAEPNDPIEAPGVPQARRGAPGSLETPALRALAGSARATLGGTDRPEDATVKLGLMLGYSGAELRIPIERIQLAEKLGFDSV